MRVVLGGTFDPLHKGHKALFQKAFELALGDRIIVGLTSDDMANRTRERVVTPFPDRKRPLDEYISTMMRTHPGTKCDVIEITEVFNVPITQEIDADAIVVSEGRKGVAEDTNEHRKRFGKPPLTIVVVPYVLAMDGLPITASRIVNGEIDAEGWLVGKVKIAVGTDNDVKLQAVENIFQKVFKSPEVVKVNVPSDVPVQPWGDDTIAGARNRAEGALNESASAHFGVGIEAGLFKDDVTDNCYDVQYCAIRDRGGHVTVGHGPGFYYPPSVVDALRMGKSVGEVMSALTGIKEIGKKKGAIGYLSNDILDRLGLTEQAVIMALVPRLSELYESY